MNCVTTLNQIYRFNPCEEGWNKLLGYLDKTEPDDEPLPLGVVLESNGFHDAVWCLQVCGSNNERVENLTIRYMCWCLRQLEPILTPGALDAVLVAIELYAWSDKGDAAKEELGQALVDFDEIAAVAPGYRIEGFDVPLRRVVYNVRFPVFRAIRCVVGDVRWALEEIAGKRAANKFRDDRVAKFSEMFCNAVSNKDQEMAQ